MVESRKGGDDRRQSQQSGGAAVGMHGFLASWDTRSRRCSRQTARFKQKWWVVSGRWAKGSVSAGGKGPESNTKGVV